MSDTDPFKMTASAAMQFVKVTIKTDSGNVAGYLTPLSCEMLRIELERDGYSIIENATAPT